MAGGELIQPLDTERSSELDAQLLDFILRRVCQNTGPDYRRQYSRTQVEAALDMQDEDLQSMSKHGFLDDEEEKENVGERCCWKFYVNTKNEQHRMIELLVEKLRESTATHIAAGQSKQEIIDMFEACLKEDGTSDDIFGPWFRHNIPISDLQALLQHCSLDWTDAEHKDRQQWNVEKPRFLAESSRMFAAQQFDAIESIGSEIHTFHVLNDVEWERDTHYPWANYVFQWWKEGEGHRIHWRMYFPQNQPEKMEFPHVCWRLHPSYSSDTIYRNKMSGQVADNSLTRLLLKMLSLPAEHLTSRWINHDHFMERRAKALCHLHLLSGVVTNSAPVEKEEEGELTILDEVKAFEKDDDRDSLQYPHWIANHQTVNTPYKCRTDVGITNYGQGKFYHWTITFERAVATKTETRSDHPIYLICMDEIEFWKRSKFTNAAERLEEERFKLCKERTCTQIVLRTPLTELMIRWLQMDDEQLREATNENKDRLPVYRQSMVYHLCQLGD